MNEQALARRQRRTGILAAVAGTVLEYYDFAVYGFLALYIARTFFPAGDSLVSLLLTVATFGVGFVMRPVGAVVLGGYADRAGRKAGLTLTITMMAAGTAIIAITPGYATIGALAPILVVCGRLLQGFSGGGELGSATAFLLEQDEDGRCGRLGSLQQVSQALSLLAGSLVSAVFAATLTPEQMNTWGWRIPFLIGLLILPVGLVLRTRVAESEAFLNRAAATHRPVRAAVTEHGGKIAIGFGITVAWTVFTYVLLIYMPTYSVRELGLTPAQALGANALGLVSVALFAFLSGSLADRIGHRKPMFLAAAGVALLVYAAFSTLTTAPSVMRLAILQIGLGALIGVYTGPAPSLLGRMFPVSVRSSGFSLAYNLAVTVFGGFAPFISTWLISSTGSKLAPAIYVVFAATTSVVALAFLGLDRKTANATVATTPS